MIGEPTPVVSLHTWILLVHAFATVAMTGLIWFVQIVHYPLFASVDANSFIDYEHQHVRRTTWIVAPLMLAELVTAALILLWPAPAIAPGLCWSGAVLVVVVWVSTAVLQIPCHRRLEEGADEPTIHRLVFTNWIRTIAWTLRAGLALWMLAIAA